MKQSPNYMKWEIPENIYEPEEDSFLLLSAVKNFLSGLKKYKNLKILEIGCGSGIISIEIAKSFSNSRVTCSDINKEAIKATKKNAEANKAKIKCIESDMFSSFSNTSEKFDLIIFNPPYLPVRKNDPDNRKENMQLRNYSGGPSGREIIEKFISQSGKYLKKGGKLFLLISSLTGEKEVIEIFRKNGFSPKIIARKKIPWEELIVLLAFHSDNYNFPKSFRNT